MKRIAAFIICLIVIGLSCMGAIISGQGPDTGKDRTIEKLWKDYEAARRSDLPQKQMEILQEIKNAASASGAWYDFYRAGNTYASVRTSVNWKDCEAASEQWKAEAESCGSPIVGYAFRRDRGTSALDYVKEHGKQLEKSCNREFYESLKPNSKFGPILPDMLSNDYDYALWDLGTSGTAEAREILKDRVSDSYPLAAFLEYFPIADQYRLREPLEAFADRYKGKAVALLAREDLLWQKFHKLEDSDAAASSDFKALRSEIDSFEAERKAFNGDEARIASLCTAAERLAGTLDAKDINANIHDGLLTISLQNVQKVNLELKLDGKSTLKKELENTRNSYYVSDTLKFTLPAMDDGSYEVSVSSGKVESKFTYDRYTISAAQKRDSKGYAVFLADYLSGKPLERTDIRLIDWKGRDVASYNGLALNGFTYLPKEITDKLNGDTRRFSLEFSLTENGVKRLSRELSVNTSLASYGDSGVESLCAQVLTDCGAYHPGDTLKFKAVLYKGDYLTYFRTLEAGKKFKAVLKDAQYKTIATKELSTNEFGSIASEFVLERRERNGRYSLSIENDGRTVETVYFTVDDFVLPSFELTFDRDDNLYLPGDEVTVNGAIKSYSGHSLSSAKVVYTVERSGNVVEENTLTPASDGSFAVKIATDAADRYASYSLNVKVTDATGETLEWNRWLSVNTEIPLYVKILDTQVGECNPGMDIISSDKLRMNISVGENLRRESLLITYSVFFKDKEIHRGVAENGKDIELDLSGYPSGNYKVKAEASAKNSEGLVKSSDSQKEFLKLKDGDSVLDAPVENVFRVLEGGDVALQLGAARGPVWAAVEICGFDNRSLVSELVHLDGVQGKEGSLKTLRYEFGKDWGDAVTMYVMYFRNGRRYSYEHEYRRAEVVTDELPLSFSRFLDKTLPGQAYSFTIKTLPGVECAAGIFDKSTETIDSNAWYPVRLEEPQAPYMRFSYQNGVNSGFGDYAIGFGVQPRMKGALMFRSASVMAVNDVAADADFAVAEESVSNMAMLSDAALEGVEEEADAGVAVRSDFASALAFEPFLRSDDKGEIQLDFRTSDKLSTFIVSLYAHDKQMKNSVLRREMVVSIPVKVSVAEPQFLYSGDQYTLRATLSSSAESEVCGTLRLEAFPGSDYKTLKPLTCSSVRVSIAPGESKVVSLQVDVPQVEELGLKITFVADSQSDGSDAVFVSVPVHKPSQTITEAHSAVLRPGADEQALIDTLRSQFVNFDGLAANVKVTPVIDLIREALPSRVNPSSKDVLSLTDAFYSARLSSKLGSEVSGAEGLVEKILDCNNADGGYAWFAGMKSSPALTAVVIGRFAALKEKGIALPAMLEESLAASVKYLDSSYFGDKDRPFWCGGLSLSQYLYVRSLYANQPLDISTSRDFRKAVREYLVPSKSRGLQGEIFGKARRSYIIYRLLGSSDGLSLAKSLGVNLATRRRLQKSLNADLASLKQYAVEHRCGGIYFPNAVMPFRGLMESEAYAHSLICNLLRDCGENQLADGLRLWLMIQKETQQWSGDPGFIDALASVLDGSREVLDTKIVSLTASGLKPFSEIQAAGNGFTIERAYSVERMVDGKKTLVPLADGDTLNVGDRVVAEYKIWNEENRSFVRVSALRPACLRPSAQLSGMYGWWLAPLRVSGFYVCTPQGYRNVLTDRTEYWFDSYPEETTTISEEFFVTQEGRFQQGVVEVESLYAPHYRANGASEGPLCSSAGA